MANVYAPLEKKKATVQSRKSNNGVSMNAKKINNSISMVNNNSVQLKWKNSASVDQHLFQYRPKIIIDYPCEIMVNTKQTYRLKFHPSTPKQLISKLKFEWNVSKNHQPIYKEPTETPSITIKALEPGDYQVGVWLIYNNERLSIGFWIPQRVHPLGYQPPKNKPICPIIFPFENS